MCSCFFGIFGSTSFPETVSFYLYLRKCISSWCRSRRAVDLWVFLFVFFSGYHFIKPYYRFKFSPLDITKVNAMSIYRKVVPGGPARFLSQEGDYVVGVGQVSSLDTDWSIYLYDTNGTLNDITDDSYTSIFTTDEGMISTTMIKGDYITWSVFNEGCNTSTIKGYQISTQSLFTIHTDAFDPNYSRDGNNLVFSYNGVSSVDIKYYNLSTRSGIDICTTNDYQLEPEICGNNVIWTDYRNKQTLKADIYRYDLTTQQEYVVANTSDDEYKALINNNSIVYNVSKATTNELRIYDLTNSSDTLICSASNSGIVIVLDSINSSYVAYDVTNSTGTTLYLYSIANSTSTQIVNSVNIISNAILGSNQFVYIVNNPLTPRYGSVYGYSISSSTGYTIRNTGKTYMEMSINSTNDYLVITSKGSGNDPDEWDVSLITLP